jgi:hypothetical protein
MALNLSARVLPWRAYESVIVSSAYGDTVIDHHKVDPHRVLEHARFDPPHSVYFFHYVPFVIFSCKSRKCHKAPKCMGEEYRRQQLLPEKDGSKLRVKQEAQRFLRRLALVLHLSLR